MTTITLSCDMTADCKAPVAYIDIKGYIYCAHHGRERKDTCRCRKLTPTELRVLESGEPLAAY